MQQTNSETVKPSKGFGLCNEPQEIGAGTLPEVRLPGIPFLLDLVLVKPTQDMWTKFQEMFCCLSKSVISERTLMSTIGLLASMEKMVKLSWKFPMSLKTPIPWNQKMIRHGE